MCGCFPGGQFNGHGLATEAVNRIMYLDDDLLHAIRQQGLDGSGKGTLAGMRMAQWPVTNHAAIIG